VRCFTGKFSISLLSICLLTVHTKIFYDVTTFFSQKKECHLSTTIPAMNHIGEFLISNITNQVYSGPILTSLEIGKTTLNRYYSLTNGSASYCIAMGESYTFPLPFIY
jgi:hypothetical protein